MYQAPSHELAAKTLDFSPSSIRDRWASGRRDMASGLALLEPTADATRRFSYLPIDAHVATIEAEAGALNTERKLGRAA
ncbi:DUF3734 domain-containing protein [Geminicoccus harenae]|uniref:DUF3734 domain-containing protein n=1 Tax=Geminicoccus harenae TaxID=2498453 RepID=UPI002103351B|nr:DUF3734 domain-containing protein [Geminicoccus harenae]